MRRARASPSMPSVLHGVPTTTESITGNITTNITKSITTSITANPTTTSQTRKRVLTEMEVTKWTMIRALSRNPRHSLLALHPRLSRRHLSRVSTVRCRCLAHRCVGPLPAVFFPFFCSQEFSSVPLLYGLEGSCWRVAKLNVWCLG